MSKVACEDVTNKAIEMGIVRCVDTEKPEFAILYDTVY
jgi:hypothetical protein